MNGHSQQEMSARSSDYLGGKAQFRAWGPSLVCPRRHLYQPDPGAAVYLVAHNLLSSAGVLRR